MSRQRRQIEHLQPLIRVDIKDPFPARLRDRVVAGGGKVLAPLEGVELDREAEGLFDRVVAGAGVHHDDLIHDADE